MLSTLFALFVVYQIKHFVCDYPLQTPWMLGKFKEKGWVAPLAAHAGVHGLATFLIFAYLLPDTLHFLPVALGLAAFDFTIHFTMDRVKASPKLMGRWKPLTKDEYLQAASAISVPFNEEAPDFRKKLLGNTFFWWALGFDQMVHHLTHYAVIFFYASVRWGFAPVW